MCTSEDINNRIMSAIEDANKYGEIVNFYAKSKVYTDKLNAEETYEKVCNDLNLKKKNLK